MTAPSIKEALEAVEPYLDAITCYASTINEHEGNRVARLVRSALATLSPPAGERREAIARTVDERVEEIIDHLYDLGFIHENEYRRARKSLLASGLVQDEAAIRKDEREKCAKIADDASDNSDKASNTYDGGSGSLGYESACTDIAAAIRTGRDGGAET